MRILSLLPSATEIVHALGRGSDLVGRSAECDFPPEVASLPVVMRARSDDSGRTSAEIDARVRAARGRSESLYLLDAQLLGALAPEVVLTQELCGVCSVTGEEVAEACRRARVSPRILSLTPSDLAGVERSIGEIGAAIGAGASADALIAELRARQAAVVGRPPSRPKSVAVVEWVDPPILAGLWTPELIRLAGGSAVGGVRAGAPAVTTSWPALAAHPPELLVVSPCSFPVERTLGELARPGIVSLLEDPRLPPIWVADESYFSRPGPRLWDGLELLADLLDGRSPRAPYPCRERAVPRPSLHA